MEDQDRNREDAELAAHQQIVQRRALFMREGGAVKRCHTMPWHGDYTVAQHSYNMLSLMFVLHPEPSVNLIQAITCHDLSERYVGDIPAPFKWGMTPDMSEELTEMENRVLRHYKLDVDLTEEEEQWLHGLDRTELLMSAKDQLAMGNMAAQQMVVALAHWFQRKGDAVPEPIRTFAANHAWGRLPDILPE